MKFNPKFNLVLLILASLLVWSYYTFNVPKPNLNGDSQNQTKTSQIQPDIIEANQTISLTISGWIPTWAYDSGYSTLEKNISKFDSVSPVWYEVLADGSLKETKPKNYQQLLQLARSKNLKIIPSIAMFDHSLFSQVLQNPQNLANHIDSIYSTVMNNEYDGIDLDYESTKLQDKDKYFEFLENLSNRLKIQNKILTVTVLAKWGEEVIYPYLPQTRQVQDWSKISQYADEIRIMAYDYTSASALYPGPIGPLDWIEQVMQYALTKAEPQKFVLGVHLYSYERWVEVTNSQHDLGFNHPKLQFKSSYLDNETGREPARSYTYDTVKQIVHNHSGSLETFQGEKIFKYTKTNPKTGTLENRVLVFIDPQGVQQRLDLAKQYKLKGVIFWQLGGANELIQSLEK